VRVTAPPSKFVLNVFGARKAVINSLSGADFKKQSQLPRHPVMWVGSRLTTALYALVQIRQALYSFNINLIDKKEAVPSKCHYISLRPRIVCQARDKSRFSTEIQLV
jgi:hypothetical protein